MRGCTGSLLCPRPPLRQPESPEAVYPRPEVSPSSNQHEPDIASCVVLTGGAKVKFWRWRGLINCKGHLYSQVCWLLRRSSSCLFSKQRDNPVYTWTVSRRSGIDQRVIDSKRFRVQIESKSKGVSGSTMQLNAKWSLSQVPNHAHIERVCCCRHFIITILVLILICVDCFLVVTHSLLISGWRSKEQCWRTWYSSTMYLLYILILSS